MSLSFEKEGDCEGEGGKGELAEGLLGHFQERVDDLEIINNCFKNIVRMWPWEGLCTHTCPV